MFDLVLLIVILQLIMGATKNTLFSEEQNAMAALAKALGHPARIAIIEHLCKSLECVNGGLVEVTGLSQATVSQHLKELVGAGILKSKVHGASVCYCIHPEFWIEIKTRFNCFFDSHPICNDKTCN